MEMNIIVTENIAETIQFFRGHKVILDFHLARLYEVETRSLKQQVKRNLDRFPEDFMFELGEKEFNGLISQKVIPNKRAFGGAAPMAFPEIYKCLHNSFKPQGNRVKVRGQATNGIAIEMWVNKATKTIETAYPIQ